MIVRGVDSGVILSSSNRRSRIGFLTESFALSRPRCEHLLCFSYPVSSVILNSCPDVDGGCEQAHLWTVVQKC